MPPRQPRPSYSPYSPKQPAAGYNLAYCAQHAVVLSVSPAHGTFSARQAPEFSISVVSTQRAACPFNVGSSRLALVIKQGKTKLWSSADCPGGARSAMVRLRRGVPVDVPVTWKRQTATAGCNGIPHRVPSGSYTAYAVEGPLVSAPDTFRLG